MLLNQRSYTLNPSQ